MANTKEKNGFLLINKPTGPSSHDIIYQLRKITGIKKIGHSGTLDPFASGLLLIAIEDATRVLRHYVGLDKTYEAILRLGATSDTQDRTGKIEEGSQPEAGQPLAENKHQACPEYSQGITKSQIENILKSFIGKQKQIPPMYSAKKIDGQRLYKLARKGQAIKRNAQNIEIYDIKLISYDLGLITINCKVSSGTYIRTLTHDIGAKLGCGAYLEELKRTAIGDFKLENAVSISHSGGSVLATNRIHSNDTDTGLQNDNVLTKTNWRKNFIPMKTVLVSGTFDGVHKGHKNYFQQARKLGHRLFAIVARDSIVKKIKNKTPKYSEKERVKQVKQCKEVDRVYLGVDGSEEKIYDFVADIKPDIIALGYDQKAYTENLEKEMKKRLISVKITKLKPFKPEKYKSSTLN